MGWWGLANPYGVRILDSLKIIGRSLTECTELTRLRESNRKGNESSLIEYCAMSIKGALTQYIS